MATKDKLLLIKIVHTVIWALFVGIIFYILYSGITDRVTIYTWIGIGIILGEGLVLVIFRMYCPLTVLARKYSDSQRHNFDIFLPEWLAKYNKLIFTTLFLIGVVIAVYRVV